MFEPIAILPNFRMFKNIYLITLLVTFSDELCKCKYSGDIQSCLPVGHHLKNDSQMLKTRLRWICIDLHVVYCQKALSKPSFNKVRFACHPMSYLAFRKYFGCIMRFVLHIAFLCHTYELEMTILSDKIFWCVSNE